MDDYRQLVLKNLEKLEKEALRSPAYAWSNGISTIEYIPPVLYICPTNFCTHSCNICAHKEFMRRGLNSQGEKQRGMLTWDRFKKIVDQIPDQVARIYFYKQGEPLLNKNFNKMAKYLRQKVGEDVELALSTNGTVLSEKHHEALIENFNIVVFSIYSLNRETFKKLHGQDTFEKVIFNYKLFHDRYEKKGEERLKVYFNYVRQEGNRHETDDEVAKFFQTNFPKFNIGIHDTFNFGGRIDEGNLKIFDSNDKSMYPVCIFPWTVFTILWDGWVSQCMVDVEESYLNNGRIPEKSIKNTINHPELVANRKAMHTGDFSNFYTKKLNCGTCSWLFHLQAQSLKYLSLYTKKVAKDFQIKYEHRCLVTSSEYLYEGYIKYLEGNIETAINYFLNAQIIATNTRDKIKAKSWFKNCVSIIRMKSNLEKWENYFNKEGITLRDLFVTKYLEMSGNEYKWRIE